MRELKYTLLSEGTSDRALIPILSWLLQQHRGDWTLQAAWADPRLFPKPPKSLSEKIQLAVTAFPCDLLFVHRDSDKAARADRVKEIEKALAETSNPISMPVVPVVPVRMLEAWLLHSEDALRQAAGKPRGKPRGGPQLEMPKLHEIEQIADPKAVLNQLLRDASGATGRRLWQFSESERTQRLANLIDDFSPLQSLSAFQEMETEIHDVLANFGA